MRTIPSSTFQGRFQLLRHDPVGGSSGRSVVHTPRHRETGRPRAAQFAPWAVYTPGGGRRLGGIGGRLAWFVLAEVASTLVFVVLQLLLRQAIVQLSDVDHRVDPADVIAVARHHWLLPGDMPYGPLPTNTGKVMRFMGTRC